MVLLASFFFSPELWGDLNNFSFKRHQDVVKEGKQCNLWMGMGVHNFSPRFLECLKQLVCCHSYSCFLHILIL